jgi:HAD superfamily hydrolase (TIGR01490 family)
VNAGPAAAIFDMDGTLTRADTFLAYLKFVLARRKQRLGNCLGLPLAVAQFRLGIRSRDWLKQQFVRAVLGGSSASEIETLTSAFVDRHGSRLLKPAASAALRRHRSRGDRLIIASASLDIYTAALAASWDIPEVVCTRLEWRSGMLTGRLSGPNLRGEAKLAALKEMLGAMWDGRPRIFAYSDDHSDLPLLKFADQGFAVDPTRKLAACASREGLQIVSWKGTHEAGSPDNILAMLPGVAHVDRASLINKN